MDFISIDFETANSKRDSACQIGLAFVEGMKVTGSTSFLIRPEPNYFDPFNTSLHGIDGDHVKDAPTFKELWPDLLRFFEGKKLFAHNAGFDFSVLRNQFDKYDIDFPSFDYSCSYQLAKQSFPGLASYRLNYLSKELGIPLNHHEAESDAIACAAILIKCFTKDAVLSFEDLEKVYQIRTGGFGDLGHYPSLKKIRRAKKDRNPKTEITTGMVDQDGDIFESVFVFTGTLSSMARSDAQLAIYERGGDCGKSVTAKTNYLVIGEQDFGRFGEGFISTKMKKAIGLIDKGAELEILSEQQFIELL
jgi:DNA polymerase-3 subunit epsilon